MKVIKSLIITFVVLQVLRVDLYAQELKTLKGFEGYWKFSVGDNMDWIKPEFDDSDWDKIRVPNRWESEGYDEYNGFAWYRKTFKISDIENYKSLYLLLGKIDDIDEVFVNGKKIGQNGKFFPNYTTAYNVNRKYKIPLELLNVDANNTIAVRVYDMYLNGGIVQGPVGLYYDLNDELIDINLEGQWSFALSQPSNNINPKLSSLEWTKIKVPQKWEEAGFENYDGYAIYMKTFTISSELAQNDLVLLLGKIDDYDYVYFNGTLIGNVFDLKKKGAYFRKGDEYKALRAYHIPDELINKNDKNTIVVKVYDYYKDGGIYEGPIGVITKEKFRYFENKYYGNNSIWDLIFN